jgi:hypothetical protein
MLIDLNGNEVEKVEVDAFGRLPILRSLLLKDSDLDESTQNRLRAALTDTQIVFE